MFSFFIKLDNVTRVTWKGECKCNHLEWDAVTEECSSSAVMLLATSCNSTRTHRTARNLCDNNKGSHILMRWCCRSAPSLSLSVCSLTILIITVPLHYFTHYFSLNSSPCMLHIFVNHTPLPSSKHYNFFFIIRKHYFNFPSCYYCYTLVHYSRSFKIIVHWGFLLKLKK